MINDLTNEENITKIYLFYHIDYRLFTLGFSQLFPVQCQCHEQRRVGYAIVNKPYDPESISKDRENHERGKKCLLRAQCAMRSLRSKTHCRQMPVYSISIRYAVWITMRMIRWTQSVGINNSTTAEHQPYDIICEAIISGVSHTGLWFIRALYKYTARCNPFDYTKYYSFCHII